MKMPISQRFSDRCENQPLGRRSLILMFVIMAFCCTPAMAQRNEAGKEIAKELLRALIESQLERQGRESFGPGRPVPPGIGEIPRPTQATPEMIQIRRILASMSQDTNALSAVVSEEGRRNPELRRLTADVIQFQGSFEPVSNERIARIIMWRCSCDSESGSVLEAACSSDRHDTSSSQHCDRQPSESVSWMLRFVRFWGSETSSICVNWFEQRMF
jgi:hypothetical protein